MDNNELNQLTETDKNKLKEVTKAYTDEEYKTILRVVPDDHLWDELIRRNTSMTKGIDYVANTLDVSLDSIIPISAKAWDEMKTRYDDLKIKFSKIRQFFGGNIQ